MKSFREFVAEDRTFPARVRLLKPTPDVNGDITSGALISTFTHFGMDYTHPFQRRREVPINKLIWNEPGKFEPDTIVPSSRQSIDRMKKTIKSGGRLPPVSVVHEKGRYRLIDGHHRLQAHIEAGKRMIDVHVVDPRVVRPASIEDVRGYAINRNEQPS